jgi:hypothetical protein
MKNNKGLVHGEIMDDDDAAQYESAEVISKVTERLKELGGNPPEVTVDDPPAKPKKAVPEVETETDDTPTSEAEEDLEVQNDDQEVEVDEDDDGIEASEVKDDELVIPEQLFRAAQHSEWSTEEITDFWKSNPEVAKKTFEKLHKDMVSINNVYAEHGRAAKELQQRKQTAEQNAVVQKSESKPKSFVDVEKATELYGEEAGALFSQLNNALVELTSRQQPAPANTQRNDGSAEVKQEKSLAVLQQMGQWFADPNLKSYEEFYGKGTDDNGLPIITNDHLTNEQMKNRENLLDVAADIEAGMALRGGSTSVSDVMSRAHIIVTKDIQTAVIRDDILKKAKKRSKGVTLRPSGNKIKPKEKLKPGEKKSEKRLLKDTERRLAAMQAGKTMV